MNWVLMQTIIFLGCNLSLTFSLPSQEMMYNGARTRHLRRKMGVSSKGDLGIGVMEVEGLTGV
jgi:hypothetical protein